MAASLFGVGNVINLDAQGTLMEESFVATAGQLIFDLTSFSYAMGSGSIKVFVNGQKQRLGYDYAETTSTRFTWLSGDLAAEDRVDVIGFPEIDLSNNVDPTIRPQLASTSSPSDGAGMVGVDYAGTSLRTLMYTVFGRTAAEIAAGVTPSNYAYPPGDVRRYGAVAGGIVDCSAAINVAGSIGTPTYIVHEQGGYLINSTVTFDCDVYCTGYLVPSSSIGSASNDYDKFCVILASSGYADRRVVQGLSIHGSVALRAANVSGIRNDCENSIIRNSVIYQLNYGIVGRNYGQTYDKCHSFQCNTNFCAYARDASHEINALTITGGSYDSPVSRSVSIGDSSWSDAFGGSNYHGTAISITGGAVFDGGEIRIDRCIGVTISGIYVETSASNFGVVVGSFDDSVRDITVEGCFFKTLRVAVNCLFSAQNIRVIRNTCVAVSESALRVVSDIYPVTYVRGTQTASFSNGREVHTGFRSLSVSAVVFDTYTIPHVGLNSGTQVINGDAGEWYPGGVLQDHSTVKMMNASSACRFYSAPSLSKSGSLSGSTFTFTTPSDCYSFNGGDRVTITGTATYAYVRSVNYSAGTMLLDGGSAGTATAISQNQATFCSSTVTYTGAAPSAGTWSRGDDAKNGVAAAGQPKGWLCTVSGTPGTWVSTGNL